MGSDGTTCRDTSLMARLVRIKGIVARYDNASFTTPGSVVIDRNAGLFTARPLGRRKTFELPLSTVVDMVCQRVVRAELTRKRLEKAKARRERKAGPR